MIGHDRVRSGDVQHRCAAIDRLLATGFTHVSGFDTGLAHTVEHFRSRGHR